MIFFIVLSDILSTIDTVKLNVLLINNDNDGSFILHVKIGSDTLIGSLFNDNGLKFDL